MSIGLPDFDGHLPLPAASNWGRNPGPDSRVLRRSARGAAELRGGAYTRGRGGGIRGRRRNCGVTRPP